MWTKLDIMDSIGQYLNIMDIIGYKIEQLNKIESWQNNKTDK